MAYVVGSAEVELVPTAQGFDAKAEALIGDLRVGVKLDPDIAGMKAEIAAATAAVKPEVGVKVKLEENAFDAQLAAVKAQLADLKAKMKWDPNIPELKAQLKIAQATMQDLKVHVGIDNKDFIKVAAELKALEAFKPGGDVPAKPPAGAGAGALAASGPLIAGVSALVAALLPIASVTLAATLGLTGLAVAATAGIGVFAGITMAALATDKAFKTALQPTLDGLKSAFDSLVSSNLDALLAPLQAGLGLLAQILPQLTPLLQAGSQAIMGLLKPLQDAVASGAFAKFIAQITPLVGPAVAGFGAVLGNLTKGVVDLVLAFAPFGKIVLDGLVKLTEAFAGLTKTQAFKDFMADITKQAPIVMSFFGALLGVLGPLLSALMPLGVVLLQLSTPLLGLIAQLLQALVPLFISLEPLVAALLPPFTALVAWLAQGLVPALVILVNVVITVLSWIGQFVIWMTKLSQGNVTEGRKILGVWDGIKSFFAGIGKWFAGIWEGLIKGVSSMVADVGKWFQQLPGKIMGFLGGVGKWLLKAGIDLVNGLATGILLGAVFMWDLLVRWPVKFITWLVGMIPIFIDNGTKWLTSLADGIVQGFIAVSTWFLALPGVILSFVVSAGQWIYQTGIDILTGLLHGILEGAVAFYNWFTALPAVILNFFVGAADWIYHTGIDILTGLIRGVTTGYIAVSNWFNSLPRAIANFFIGAGQWLLDTGEQIVNGLWNGVRNIWDGFMGWIRDRINAIPKAIRDVLGIASPSKVMAEIGGFMGEGLQVGLSRSIGTAMDAARTQIRSSVSGLGATATATIAATVDATALGGGTVTTNNSLQQILGAVRELTQKTPSAQDQAFAQRMFSRSGGTLTGGQA